MTQKIEFTPIGIIHASLKKYKSVPAQPHYSDIEGTIEIFEEYKAGLKDLDHFEYIICIAYLHLVKTPVPLQSPGRWGPGIHGVFAIRTPRRPNPIGFSIFKLLSIEENILHVKNLDFVDKTPVLDIKPFFPKVDNRETPNIGNI